MIDLSSAIHNLLSGSTGITYYVNDRIYPVIVPVNTPTPYITFERTFDIENISGIYTSNLEIYIYVSDMDYDKSINIALAVNDLLNGFEGIVSDVIIEYCNIISGGEGIYDDNVIVQNITYSLKTRYNF